MGDLLPSAEFHILLTVELCLHSNYALPAVPVPKCIIPLYLCLTTPLPLQAREGTAAASGSSASPTPVISPDPVSALPAASEKTKSEQTPANISQGVGKEVDNSIALSAITGPAGQACIVTASFLDSSFQVQHCSSAISQAGTGSASPK